MKVALERILSSNISLWVAGFIAMVTGYVQLQHLISEVAALKRDGSPIMREKILLNESHDRIRDIEILALKQQMQTTSVTLQDLRDKMNIVVDYVTEQKRRQRNETTSSYRYDNLK